MANCKQTDFDHCCLASQITLSSMQLIRAGFSLSRALLRKKCVGPSPGAADPTFPEKNWRPFFSHHRLSAVSSAVSPLFIWSSLSLIFISLVHSGVAHYFRHVAMLQKICRSSCGGPFLWGPCSAEHVEHAQIRRCS